MLAGLASVRAQAAGREKVACDRAGGAVGLLLRRGADGERASAAAVSGVRNAPRSRSWSAKSALGVPQWRFIGRAAALPVGIATGLGVRARGDRGFETEQEGVEVDRAIAVVRIDASVPSPSQRDEKSQPLRPGAQVA